MMDMLRWILLLLGIIAIAALYAFFRWQEVRSARGAQLQSGYQRNLGSLWRRLKALVAQGVPWSGERSWRGRSEPTGRSGYGSAPPVPGHEFEPSGPLEPFDGVVSNVRVAAGDRDRLPDIDLTGAPGPGRHPDWALRPTGTRDRNRDGNEGDHGRHPPGVRVRPRDPDPAQPRRPDGGAGGFGDPLGSDPAGEAFPGSRAGQRQPTEPAREEPAQPGRSARGSREEQDRVGAAPGTAPSGVRQRPTPEPDPQGQDVPSEPAPETDEPRQQRRQTPAPEAGRPEPERLPDRVVVLHVVAGQGYVFPASVVVAEVEALGLLLDENYLFQAFPGQDRRRTPWFGVASMVAPGVFPPGQVDRMETPGVALFMQVPGPVAGVEIFNQMLDTSRRLAARLDGLLLDDRRKRITAETINRLQEELSAYGRQTGDRDR